MMVARITHPICLAPVWQPSNDSRQHDEDPSSVSSLQLAENTMASDREQRPREIAKPDGSVASSTPREPDEALLIRKHANSLSTVTCSACHTSQSLAPTDVTSILQCWSSPHGSCVTEASIVPEGDNLGLNTSCVQDLSSVPGNAHRLLVRR